MLLTNIEKYATQVMSSDDDVLQTTRNIRLALVNEQLTQSNLSTILTDADSFEILHKNLQELDKQALQSKRIAVETDSNNLNAALLSQLFVKFQEVTGSTDVFIDNNNVGAIPNPEDEIKGAAAIIDGELDVGVIDQSHDAFMSTVGQEIAERKRKEAELALQDF